MDNIKFYGTRGSCTLTSSKYMEFGGGTTCIMLNLNNTNIMVDCGSGVNNAMDDLKKIDELYLFISHSHLDHITGIPTLLSNFTDKKIHIYAKSFNGISIKDSITKLMNNQLWPVRVDTYKNVDFNEITDTLIINDITISNMDSNHIGGCSLYRFDYKDSSIVTAFDFCHLDGYDKKLCEFAKNVTSIIYDGTLSEEEFDSKKDWGHSTYKMGAIIGNKCNAKNVYITHYGAFDDETLIKWEDSINKEYPNVIFARSGNGNIKLDKIIEIGAILATEKDHDKLLLKIVEVSMDITNADGGTLYLLNDNKLDFKVLINKTKNTKLVKKSDNLSVPVDINGKNVCSTSAREKKLINIDDCYLSNKYDFSGTKNYDALNNYLTKSVIVVPLIDEYDDVVGVLQLINAKNNEGEIISFKKQDESALKTLANQASISIVNSLYSTQINDLLYGFVKVMSVGIDERTPYNANHTRNMVRFAENFFNYEEKINGKYQVDYKKQREILMSIWLHDVGKILTPIDIMNKDSRLGVLYNDIVTRFERINLLYRLDLANNIISKDRYDVIEKEREEDFNFISQLNKTGFLTDEFKEKLEILKNKKYKELDGTMTPLITNDEYIQLSIIKGTLNFEERKIMEGHVSYTQKFLSQLNFPKYYNDIPLYSGSHHEFLDGSGYPNHLTKDDLPWPCRLITICDIFEALTAKDRPYKKAMSVEKSFSILYEMASIGKLDESIIKEFENSKCWE